MLGSLLTTKLYFPPVRPALVPRPRLVERLQQGLQGPLTLISAPAGSGKTTLLSEWRAEAGAQVPLAWFSLDSGDNDPSRFFHHLVASLDLLQPGLLAGTLPLLQTPEALQPEAVLIPLINNLNTAPQDLLLVLDDYHVIETASIHAGLAFLLEHLPARLHIALLTRADPPLPLSRLRARGHLVEVREEHLRFNLDETADFLQRVMGVQVSQEQVAALEKRTEGWIAGLQLAALSMQGRDDVDGFVLAFTGSNHFIVDYLGEEVLNRQPQPVREFLLKTSILNRLTGPLCDAVAGGNDGDAILEQLEHANLFVIPLDKDQRWYRYHHLFADLLRSRLSHSLPDDLPLLHVRAAKWFEENGLIEEAIDHALSAKDYTNAARLFCSDSLAVIYTCSITTLERWLRAFPQAFIQADPRLCLVQAHMLWSTGRRDQIAPWVASTREALAARAAADPKIATEVEYLTLLGDTYTFESLLVEAGPAEAVELAKKAVDLIPKTARNRAFALGALYLAYQEAGEIDKTVDVASETVDLTRALNYPSMLATATYTLCWFLKLKGKLHQAERVAKETLEFARRRGQERLFYFGFVYVSLADILYERNSLEEAESLLEKSRELIRHGGTNILLVNVMFSLATIHLARGEYHKAMQTVEQLELECKEMDRRAFEHEVEVVKIRCRAGLGDPVGVAEWVDNVDLSSQRKPEARSFSELLLAARFLLLLDRVKEALPVLDGLEALAGPAGYTSWLMQVLVLQALAWKKEGEISRALAVLEKALLLAQPEGYVRVFLNAGPEMLELLQLANKRNISPEFTAGLLSAFTTEPGGTAAVPVPAKPGLLSKREIELLSLIADGCSNKEIATRLVISLGTVKRHTVNIFNKLDVKNRTEAVARARELKLL